VIHSVFNPHFRIQMNAVPGYPTRLWFVATKTTAEMAIETGNPDFQYELVCNKICGRNHYGMKAIIEVVEEKEYDEWYKSKTSWLRSWQIRGADDSDINREFRQFFFESVPAELQEKARIAAGLEDFETVNTQVVTISETSIN
jgi:cytochrome c oxidase subunit II